MSYVLVLNSGSSSVKFQLVDPESSATDTPLVSGLVEQVGEPLGAVTVKTGGEKYKEELEIPTHSFGLERAFAIMSEHNVGPTDVDVIAVGHRVVHGGRLFSEPQLIVADEPTGQLDRRNSQMVFELLRNLAEDGGGRTVVLSSHNPTAKDYAHRSCELVDGHLEGSR